ncbi:C40 family peptidase [Abyssibius alkaniclasticus]|uniref:C40 family peptidase n=1 Tax=Abyssibius alkaniclasticus TaxID=2881234 RepID=UPI002363CFDC|nr:NlpC/P60 family protein [Abyssibius alkaniclasticus]UPH71970.1 C40 family peptidase [Abyssibius alkaniclasticus]
MSDARLTPMRGLPGEKQRILQAIADQTATANGARENQLLWGEAFTPFDHDGGFTYGQAACGYMGWVAADALGPWLAPGHRVCVQGSFLYERADLKSPTRARLPFGARLAVTGTEGEFSETADGFVFSRHLASGPAKDHVAVAVKFIGAPYLWGGRSDSGLDCSGLVQLALQAAGHSAPRDSDMQQALGAPVTGPLKRGDLVFWRGHVGIMIDGESLLHANAYSMQVAVEPLEEAATRIAHKGGGPITHRRRLVI